MITLPESIVLPVQHLTPEARIPTLTTQGASGLDLFASKTITIQPGNRKLVPTGIAIALPAGSYGQIASRSGLAYKHRMDISARVIDRDYTGELKILLVNNGKVPFMAQQGERIAQLIIE